MTDIRCARADPVNAALIRDLPRHIGEPIRLRGWVTSVRQSKTMQFVRMRDRTGSVQATHHRAESAEIAARIDGLPPESAVELTGMVQHNSGRRGSDVEVAVQSLAVLAPAATPLPLDGNPSMDSRMNYRYLDLRSPERFFIFEIQTAFEAAVREFLLARHFTEIHSPKITAGGSESGADVFEVPYFDHMAYLVQSTQFYKQMAMAAGFDRVFEIGPIFRAERSNTNRHATEFTCIDFEISWIDSHEELMAFEEALLRHSLGVIRDRYGAEVERLFGVAVEVPEDPIPRVPLQLAHELARSAGRGSVTPLGDERLPYVTEQFMSRYAREEFGQSFVFITDFPADERPFYHMRHDGPAGSADPPLTRSFDLLWRGIEITTGGQREHRYDRLCTQAAQAGLDDETLAAYLHDYYLEMFRWGCPPHGGFGIGLNRFLMALLAQPSVRETSFVFRGPTRFVP